MRVAGSSTLPMPASTSAEVRALQAQGVPLIPITIDPGESGPFCRLMDRPQPVDLTDPVLPQGWCNFWRQDDWSGTAYFYLDAPEGLD